jgi:hypothetical protein
MEVHPPVKDIWPLGRVASDDYNPGEEVKYNMYDE